MSKIKVILDSGAFTAANKGFRLSVAAYIAFIRREAPADTQYISLDVIPSSLRRREWRLEYIEAAAKQSYADLQKMKDAGQNPIPVFHQGDPWHWLERFLSEGENYIALSTNKTASRLEQLTWLDGCFDVLTDQNGQALVRTHALGVSSNLLCSRYPWTTFDSGRWFKCGANGQILMPHFSDGRPDYSLPPRILQVTDQMQWHRNHIDRFGDHEHVDRYLQEVIGCDLTDVQYDHWHRHRACIIYLRNAIGPRLYFVVNSFEQAHLLAQCHVQSILVSYAYLKDKPEGTLERYVQGRTDGQAWATVDLCLPSETTRANTIIQ